MISVVESSKKRARKTQHQGFFSAIKHDGGGELLSCTLSRVTFFLPHSILVLIFFIKLHTENSTCCNYASGMLTKGSHLYNHLQ